MKKYFEYAGSSKFVECDHTTDPRKVEKHIIDYIILLKKEGKGYSGIKNYVSAICKYYKVMDVYLNTNKISQFLPEFKKSKKDRPYRYEEIQFFFSYLSSPSHPRTDFQYCAQCNRNYLHLHLDFQIGLYHRCYYH